MRCKDCQCPWSHHKYTLDGWACTNCECYCDDVPTEEEPAEAR